MPSVFFVVHFRWHRTKKSRPKHQAEISPLIVPSELRARVHAMASCVGCGQTEGEYQNKKGKMKYLYPYPHTHTYIYIYCNEEEEKKQGRGNKRKSRGLSYFSFRSHGSTRRWWVTWCLLVCFSCLFFFLSLVLSDGGVFNCTWLCRFFVVFFCLLLSFFCSSLLNPQQRAIEVKNTNTHTQRHTNTTAKGKKYMKWTTIGQRLSAHVYTWTARPPFEMSQH